MNLNELFEEIEGLKSKLNNLLPMKPEWQQKLDKKFRLEWNYNSNHIEGNTLTYGETELLLIFDKTTGDHTGREYEEMKAHDVAMKMVVELANDKERSLNETYIKQLNKVLLVRPFWKEAITHDGRSTKRLIEVGEYKKHSNSVRLENGEIFHYASPEEVPAKMGDLLKFYSVHSISSETNKVWLAAMMHYEFVRIHPFDDGNGRTARLVMNYVLLKNGFPPVIIKSADKRKYLDSLNKADTGNKEAFVEYIAEQLIWSLQKAIDAASGKSVEDEDDLFKEIEVLKRKILSSGDKGPPSRKSTETCIAVYKNTFRPLAEELSRLGERINEMFHSTKYSHTLGQNNSKVDAFNSLDRLLSTPDFSNISHLNLRINWEGIKSVRPLDVAGSVSVNVDLQETYYTVRIGSGTFNSEQQIVHEKFYYGQFVPKETVKEFAKSAISTLIDGIKKLGIWN